MTILGLDIGGANLKAANVEDRAINRPFPIWRHPESLASEISAVLTQFPGTDQLAVTMTAELADCFQTKTEGVRFIVEQVEASCQTSGLGPHQIHVWTTDGRFITAQQARVAVQKVAAANWHALATWVGTWVGNRTGLLIDIGSTTTDMIPLIKGSPAAIGLTDVSRLQSGELSYLAVWRTPLCAIAHTVPFRDGYCSLAAELFATTLDIYLLLGLIEEDDQNCETADGKPATKTAAHARVARIICGDRDEVTYEESVEIARFLADVQRQRLAGALDRIVRRLPSTGEFVVVSGSGSFLAQRLISENRLTSQSELISLSDRISPAHSSAACAYAVAQLLTQVDDTKNHT